MEPLEKVGFPIGEARTKLAYRLGLPYDASMQDWEYEVAEKVDFGKCLNLYSNASLTDYERFCLMEILIQITADEVADRLSPKESNKWTAVKALIYANPKLHAPSVHYWKSFRNNHEYQAIGKAMRDTWQELIDQ